MFDFFKIKKRNQENKKIEILFCFLSGSFNVSELINIISRHGFFTPSFIEKLGRVEVFSDQISKDLSNLDSVSNDLLLLDGFRIYDLYQNNSIFVHTAPNKSKTLVVYLTTNDENIFNENDGIIQELISNSRLIAAYAYNYDDDFVQNSRDLDAYKKRNITPIQTSKNVLGQIEVDVDKNPGKKILLRNTWLMSAWKMWFGRLFWDIIPKKHLLQFDGAMINKEIGDDLVYIQLYEKHSDYGYKGNRERQKKFKDWIKASELQKSNL